MIAEAEVMLRTNKKISQYDLVCMWLAITSTQIPPIVSANAVKVLKVITTEILDGYLEIERRDKENGVVKKDHLKLL